MRKRTPPPPRTVARSQSALRIEVLHPGEGPSPARGDVVQIHYTCLLAATNGCVDTSRAKGRREPMEITIGARQVVAGMEEGLQALALGAVARLHVPPHLGYGGVAAGPVPADAALIFEVEVVKLNARESAGLPVRVLRQLLVGGADGDEEEAAGSDDDGGDGAPLVPAPSLLRWASALRTPLPLPLPESAAFAAWLAAARARGLRTSELWRAVDGAPDRARRVRHAVGWRDAAHTRRRAARLGAGGVGLGLLGAAVRRLSGALEAARAHLRRRPRGGAADGGDLAS